MKLFLNLMFLTTFCIIADAAFSQARQIATHQSQTLAIESFNHSKMMMIQSDDDEEDGCTYTFTIKTSCSSPSSTTDQVTCLFGDATGAKEQGRLDDPESSAGFSPCSTVTVAIRTDTQCLQQICLLYLISYGRDVWLPEYVIVKSSNSPVSFTVFYNTSFLREGFSVGFNVC